MTPAFTKYSCSCKPCLERITQSRFFCMKSCFPCFICNHKFKKSTFSSPNYFLGKVIPNPRKKNKKIPIPEKIRISPIPVKSYISLARGGGGRGSHIPSDIYQHTMELQAYTVQSIPRHPDPTLNIQIKMLSQVRSRFPFERGALLCGSHMNSNISAVEEGLSTLILNVYQHQTMRAPETVLRET